MKTKLRDVFTARKCPTKLVEVQSLLSGNAHMPTAAVPGIKPSDSRLHHQVSLFENTAS